MAALAAAGLRVFVTTTLRTSLVVHVASDATVTQLLGAWVPLPRALRVRWRIAPRTPKGPCTVTRSGG
jgi:hypothetical protein